MFFAKNVHISTFRTASFYTLLNYNIKILQFRPQKHRIASNSVYYLFLNIKCVTEINLDILSEIFGKCSCDFLF